MKDFVKTMLAVICGIVVIQLVGCVFFLLTLAGIGASGAGKPVLPREGVLDLNFDEITLVEQAQESMPSFGTEGVDRQQAVGIWDAVQAIQKAAEDPGIKYVLLRGDAVSGGIAAVEEIRSALAAFRESGKAVVAYTENPGTGSFYLASVADKIYMSSYHGGQSMMVGVSGRMLFLKDLLDKVGVHVQLIRHGKYKSAGEMYVKNAPSEENRLQNQAMIDGMWKVLSGAIAQGRGLSEEKLNNLIDNLQLNLPEDFLAEGLVDELLDHEGLIAKLCTLAQVDAVDALHLVPFADYVDAKCVSKPSRTQVAILFADGEIVDGNATRGIAADRFVSEIDKLRKDEAVKAVVLRVNSPGGSVMASDKIKTALDLLQAEKPLVASYGNYAASGGYWISNGCQAIYSDATTLTGSIGVFSMIPEFSQVSAKLGVNVVTVSSNKHSDMFSLTRPFDQAELACLQKDVDDIYGRFVSLVSKGRNIPEAEVDEIAQGRVWVGTDALGIRLVDEIGTLKDAVGKAASLAGYISEDDYSVTAFPKPLSFAEQLLEAFGQSDKTPSILSGTPFASVGKALSQMKEPRPTGVYAQMPYMIDIR